MTSGRVSTSISLQPSRSGPPKSSAVQVVALDVGAEGAVVDDDALVDRIEVRLVPHSGKATGPTATLLAGRTARSGAVERADGGGRGAPRAVASPAAWPASGSTPEGATTARPGCSTAGGCARTASCPAAYGTVDEAQAVLGLARAESRPAASSTSCSSSLERDLWVLMAELATLPENRHKLDAGRRRRSPRRWSSALEHTIDDARRRGSTRRPSSSCPGETVVAAWLDVARTVVRRAERHALPSAAPAVARRAVPQPPLRPAVDHGPLAGGPVPLDPRADPSTPSTRQEPCRPPPTVDRHVRQEHP